MTRHFLRCVKNRITCCGPHDAHTPRDLLGSAGFTLIETLVAISLLSIAIVAPMALTAQSLATAYYARDQITAFYLAQEAIEAVRAIRDAQILKIAQNTTGEPINLFGPIPVPQTGGDRPFTIDTRKTTPSEAISECVTSCPQLETDGTLYGYEPGWVNTNFTRTVRARFITNSNQDELRITVIVQWKTGAFKERSFSIQEDLYRWVPDGSTSGT